MSSLRFPRLSPNRQAQEIHGNFAEIWGRNWIEFKNPMKMVIKFHWKGHGKMDENAAWSELGWQWHERYPIPQASIADFPQATEMNDGLQKWIDVIWDSWHKGPRKLQDYTRIWKAFTNWETFTRAIENSSIGWQPLWFQLSVARSNRHSSAFIVIDDIRSISLPT